MPWWWCVASPAVLMVSASLIMEDTKPLLKVKQKGKKRKPVAIEEPDVGEKRDAPDGEMAEDTEPAGEGTGFARAFLQILGKEAAVGSGEAPILVKQHRAVAAAAEAERADQVGQQEAKKQRKEVSTPHSRRTS